MKSEGNSKIMPFEEVIAGLLNMRLKLESEVYELESAIKVAKEYAYNKDMDFMRYLDILKGKCEKVKKLIESANEEE